MVINFFPLCLCQDSHTRSIWSLRFCHQTCTLELPFSNTCFLFPRVSWSYKAFLAIKAYKQYQTRANFIAEQRVGRRLRLKKKIWKKDLRMLFSFFHFNLTQWLKKMFFLFSMKKYVNIKKPKFLRFWCLHASTNSPIITNVNKVVLIVVAILSKNCKLMAFIHVILCFEQSQHYQCCRGPKFELK